MEAYAYLFLVAWIPATFALYATQPPRRAALLSVVLGTLFLPVTERDLPGLPPLDKEAAIGVSNLLASVLLHPGAWRRFRPGLADLPMGVYLASPFLTSLANDLGAYDGLSAVLEQCFRWGMVYFVARVHFRELAHLREVAVAIVLGALLYVPLCMVEARLSPQLHRWVYGFGQHSFLQSIRYGGYRPMVFLDHGLMVGLFLAVGTFTAAWLGLSRTVRRIFGVPMPWIVALLAFTTLLCRSMNGYVLLLGGLCVLAGSWALRSRLPVLLLALAPVVYSGVRCTGLWEGQALLDLAERVMGPERRQSLETRLVNETQLAGKARQHPWFGWGRFGRARIYDERGRDVTITDGRWIINLGDYGFVGQIAFLGTGLVALLRFLRRVRARDLLLPALAPAAALATLVGVHAVDNCMNGFVNPIYLLATGALLGGFGERRRPRTPLPGSSLPDGSHGPPPTGPARSAWGNPTDLPKTEENPGSVGSPSGRDRSCPPPTDSRSSPSP